jgi:integrase
MARTSANPRIVNRTVRAKLPVRRDPYWHLIAEGQHLGYRKTGEMQGTWIARLYTREQGRRFHSLGIADDSAPSNETTVLSFQQALQAAQVWFGSLSYADLAGVSSGIYTVRQALSDYLAHLTKVKRKPQYRTAAIVNAHILPTLGNIDLSKLTHGKVKAWRDKLAEAAPRVRTRNGKEQAFRSMDANDPDQARKRQATANRILTVLKAALNHAKTESRRIATDAAWTDVKPFGRVDVPKVRFLSKSEVTEVVRNCEPEFAKLLKGALLTGCRYGELSRLTVADFNLKDGQLYVAQSKNGEPRYVDLNSAGIEFFDALTVNREPEEKLFHRSNDKAWNTSEQFRPMNEACATAKVEGVTFHILRHTYASHALMAGMTIEVLAQQLGHKDTRITMRHYAHLCPTFKQESVRQNAPTFGFSTAGPVLVSKAG